MGTVASGAVEVKPDQTPNPLGPGENWVDALGRIDPSHPIFIGAFVVLMVVATLYFWAKDAANRGSSDVSGGLNYVVGPMGSGKSMFGVRQIVAALLAGRYVITNVRLLPGAFTELARREVGMVEARRPGAVEKRADYYAGFYVYEQSLARAMRYLIPCARCGGDARFCGHAGPEQEGRAIFVWDETHNDLNNRDYQGFGESRSERELEKERRRLVVRWATQLRKLGFVGYLLSQHHENTDAQLRRVCNHIIRLQNQRNAEGSWLARLLPRRFTLFLVYWYPAHLATGVPDHLIKPIRRERYWLPWHRTLYDSWETFHGIYDDNNAEQSPILLPSGGRRGTQAPGAPALAGVGADHDDDTHSDTDSPSDRPSPPVDLGGVLSPHNAETAGVGTDRLLTPSDAIPARRGLSSA